MVKRKTEIWYRKRLGEYFLKHYKQYDESIQWYIDPDINQWEFVIPELGLTILLTCHDNGEITEERKQK